MDAMKKKLVEDIEKTKEEEHSKLKKEKKVFNRTRHKIISFSAKILYKGKKQR